VCIQKIITIQKQVAIASLTNLFRQLFLAQLVEHKELSGQDDVVDEAASRHLDTDDDLSVWHHHGHRTEVDLQILWQLLTTGIARVLEKKETTRVMQKANTPLGQKKRSS
jgi:hypothetical protein